MSNKVVKKTIVDPIDRTENLFLILACVECSDQKEFRWFFTHDEMVKELFDSGEWMLSIITPPGQGKITFAPLCGDCAKKIYPEEALKEAHRMIKNKSPKGAAS